MELLIEAKGISKKFGSFVAVENLNLEIKKGEIFGFLGMNGAGKTTSIRMLVGILVPDSGSIKICGFDLATEAIKAKANCGYVPDRPYLYPKLTGLEFLYFVADLYKVPSKLAAQRATELLNHYRLSNYADQLIEGYSHGMKQRLALSAALIHDPKLLIVDEPMVGLDPHGAKLLKESFKKYAAEGKTIFLSTHSLNVAEELCDRVGIMHQGKLVSVSTLAELRSQRQSHDKNLEQIFLDITSEEINQNQSWE
jgi:ABC-2 type transport system ATP-binding protein